ncbi:hypothetical protein [Actinomadura harenae]|uniref:Uncharacterized protein n=1 Tax=Actinomadura harenae TaxID=2483351 RepID=A0A3M2LZ48_9ACTN|nr:hypothetical protein [Actinomadura harenae]RMI42200.1 hypothetical protein EBO15_20450 [Actinomadura harenae]
MNLDFSAEPAFSWYVLLLGISGIAMLVTAALGFGSRVRDRILYAIVGLGMSGYAFYLAFIFTGGTYHMFFYVFVLPVVLIARAVSAFFQRRKA